MTSTVVAQFGTPEAAEQAIRELVRAGVDQSELTIEDGTTVLVRGDGQRAVELAARLRELQAVGNERQMAGHGESTDAADERDEKSDTGPEHSAPRNREYSSSFDEFAGAFVRQDSSLLGDRSSADYGSSTEAYDFGYRLAGEKRFARREWADAEPELQAEWEKAGFGGWDPHRAEIHKGWTVARHLG